MYTAVLASRQTFGCVLTLCCGRVGILSLLRRHLLLSFIYMTGVKTSSATTSEPERMSNSSILVEAFSNRYRITAQTAARMMLTYWRRSEQHHFADGWWVDLMNAQFQTHIGKYKRIRCGRERHLRHLIPEKTGLCHDCGCARGEYHVFGCDSEECSNCGDQAFCCDCDTESA